MESPNAVEILLVEDNPSDAVLTTYALEKCKLANRIQLVHDGEEALDFLFCRGPFAGRTNEAPPRLVLLDLKLPKVDGLEVLRELKGQPQTRSIPVVVLTTSKEERDLVSKLLLGSEQLYPEARHAFRHALVHVDVAGLQNLAARKREQLARQRAGAFGLLAYL